MKVKDIQELISKVEDGIDIRHLYIYNDELEVLTSDEEYFVLRKEQIDGKM